MMDYSQTEKGCTQMAYGLEGVTYELDADGEIVYTQETFDFNDASQHLTFHRRLADDSVDAQERTYIMLLEADPKGGRKAAEINLHPFYVEPFPMLLATKAQNGRMTVSIGDIQTHRSESITAYIMGSAPARRV